MNKKEYTKPQTEAMELETRCSMLAGSPPGWSGEVSSREDEWDVVLGSD